MNYNFTLKGHFENFTAGQGHDLIKKRSCCISVDPYGHPEHIYGNAIALAGHYQNLLPKKLLVTFYDLGDIVRGHWSQYSDSGCQFYLEPDI